MSVSPSANGRSTCMPSACSASSSSSVLAGVSSPTAMPTLACLVGKLVSTTATRRSGGGSARSRAVRTASRATRAQRSGSAT